MDYNDVLTALRAALAAAGGEAEYNELAGSLDPLVQMSLPRHLDRMRTAGDVQFEARSHALTGGRAQLWVVGIGGAD